MLTFEKSQVAVLETWHVKRDGVLRGSVGQQYAKDTYFCCCRKDGEDPVYVGDLPSLDAAKKVAHTQLEGEDEKA